MPARAHALPEHDLLISHFEGRLTTDLLIAYYRDLVSLDAGAPLRAELVDFRRVTEVAVEPKALGAISEQITQSYPDTPEHLRCAFLTPTNLGFGLARMYELGQAPENVATEAFRRLEDALAWLLEAPPARVEALARRFETGLPGECLFEVRR